MAGQIGLEASYTEFVEEMVTVFGEVRRVLRADGTLWLNLGDSYAGGGNGGGGSFEAERANWRELPARSGQRRQVSGLKSKDLVGIPWRAPPALVEPCLLAGCPAGRTVLDPFGGAGTTGLVADRLGRNAILIELNPEYVAIAERRICDDAGMFASVAAE